MFKKRKKCKGCTYWCESTTKPGVGLCLMTGRETGAGAGNRCEVYLPK